MSYAAIVLAGGAGSRMGDAAKPLRQVAGESMLARVLAAVADASHRIVVGPPALRAVLPPQTTLTSEDPPGGGPVAAAAAGLVELAASTGTVALLAADLPFLTPATIAMLRHALDTGSAAATNESTVDGAVLVDADGREQWLCGIWRVAALRRAYAQLPDPAGVGMRRLVRELRIRTVAATGKTADSDAAGPVPWFDCDTEDDLRQAEEWAHGRPR